MDKKIKLIFNFLTQHEGFYMDQYKNRTSNKLSWICLKKLTNGLAAVIVTDDINAFSDEEAAREYLNSNMINYCLDIIILSNNGYNNFEEIKSDRIVIDNKSNEVIYSSERLLALTNLITRIIKPRDRKKEYRGSIITILLIVINVMVFIISVLISSNSIYGNSSIIKSIMDVDAVTLLEMGAKYNPYINNGDVWRLITAAFLHGGLIHLACNMYSLYIAGTQIERIYGKMKYIIIYFVSALGSSLLSYLLAPKSLSVGASGAIFGLLGALLVFAIKEKNRLSKGAIGNLFAVIGLNLYIGLTISNIDNYGHIGGLITGIIISLILSFI